MRSFRSAVRDLCCRRLALIAALAVALGFPLLVGPLAAATLSQKEPTGLSVTPSTLTFRSVIGVGLTKRLTLKNTGADPVTVSKMSTLTEPFSVASNTCAAALSRGASCSIDITFLATERSSTVVEFRIDSSNGSAVVALHGTGVTPEEERSSLEPGKAVGLFDSVDTSHTVGGQEVSQAEAQTRNEVRKVATSGVGTGGTLPFYVSQAVDKRTIAGTLITGGGFIPLVFRGRKRS
ncbi:MAG: hypothetical protein HY261_03275 [Chloroflexi bacterium]|nr:hypothetical protein [Chloroflexota bacterium]